MKKYFIGIVILGIITLGLTGYVISLGLASRQDVKTEKELRDVATKLNSYVDKKNKIPADLKEAGAENVPDTIKYSKLSESEYKVCVTYKAAKGYGGSDVSSALTGALVANAYESIEDSSTLYTPQTYYPEYTHKKGESCKTIKPYISQPISNTTELEDYCDPSSQYYTYYKDYCVDGNLEFN